MSNKTDLSLKSFFIFNSNFSSKEGEEEKKILFYHPQTQETDIKIKDVGLCEAIIKFTSDFTSDKSCESFHTQKTSQLFYQPENDYWMVMSINVPVEVKTKDKVEYNEYKGDDIQDSVYRSILKQSYNMFRLFMGTFESNFKGNQIDDKINSLKGKLEHFYSKYVLTLKLQHSDILDVFQSIQYLPVNQLLFLRVYNFITMVEATFPTIKRSIFLYNEQVVWSGINPSDLYSVYEYLIGTLFPKTTSTELQGGSLPKRYSLNSGGHYGGFITGPDCYENCVKPPKMYIFNENRCEEFHFVAYKALGGTLCLFLDELPPNDDLFHELHTFIGPQLMNIASEIGESFVLQSPSTTGGGLPVDSGAKYLYFNELDLKHQGTFHIDNRKVKNSTLPLDVMNLVTDLFNEQQVNVEISQETIVKTLNDYWIIKKSSNYRNFFVVINKNATLLEIADESGKVFEQHLKNVFF